MSKTAVRMDFAALETAVRELDAAWRATVETRHRLRLDIDKHAERIDSADTNREALWEQLVAIERHAERARANLVDVLDEHRAVDILLVDASSFVPWVRWRARKELRRRLDS